MSTSTPAGRNGFSHGTPAPEIDTGKTLTVKAYAVIVNGEVEFVSHRERDCMTYAAGRKLADVHIETIEHQLPVQEDETPEDEACAEANRFRLIYGHWQPSFEPEDLPTDCTPAERKKALKRDKTRRKQARSRCPLPSSLVDVPPNSTWLNEEEWQPELMTREEAMEKVATLNYGRLLSYQFSIGFDWWSVIEIVGHEDTDTRIIIDNEESYEERTERFEVRLVEPTYGELVKYGKAGFVASRMAVRSVHAA